MSKYNNYTAEKSGIPEFNCATTYRNWLEGILNAFKYKLEINPMIYSVLGSGVVTVNCLTSEKRPSPFSPSSLRS